MIDKEKHCELSLVIPCYNCEKNLIILNKRLNKVLEDFNVEYEIIYVNDASSDNTVKILRYLTKRYHRIVAIDLMFNVGQFRGLMCGLEHSKGKYVITMDDDLQHPPEQIPKLYYELKNNCQLDAAIGNYIEKKHSFIRNIGSFIVRKIRGQEINKPKNFQTTSFRCMTRTLVNAVTSHKTMYPAISLLIFRSTNRIKHVEVEHHERRQGKSNYNLFKLIKTFFDNVFSYTALPLKVISIIGLIVSFIGFMLAFYYSGRYLFGRIAVPGWTTMVVLLNIYSGLILLSTGIIGEYLLKVLQEVNQYPKHYIRNIYISHNKENPC